MSLKSKLNIASVGLLLNFVFYLVVGIVCLVFLPLTDFLPTLGIIGILSLTTAYGLIRKRAWAFWEVAILFFVATTFSVYTLYYTLGNDTLLSVTMLAYLFLTWISTAYTATKRKTLEA